VLEDLEVPLERLVRQELAHDVLGTPARRALEDVIRAEAHAQALHHRAAACRRVRRGHSAKAR
jgi:hypothetical protein